LKTCQGYRVLVMIVLRWLYHLCALGWSREVFEPAQKSIVQAPMTGSDHLDLRSQISVIVGASVTVPLVFVVGQLFMKTINYSFILFLYYVKSMYLLRCNQDLICTMMCNFINIDDCLRHSESNSRFYIFLTATCVWSFRKLKHFILHFHV
jgi:hypothetical protein